ncbi:MAG: hypothetical protein AAFQ65_11985, partial [Myxococcota bacterium]
MSPAHGPEVPVTRLFWESGSGGLGSIAKFDYDGTMPGVDRASRWEVSFDAGRTWTYAGPLPVGADGYYTRPGMNVLEISDGLIPDPGEPPARLRARSRVYADEDQQGPFTDTTATTTDGAAFLEIPAAAKTEELDLNPDPNTLATSSLGGDVSHLKIDRAGVMHTFTRSRAGLATAANRQGGHIVRVTNRNNSGPGSLRAALESAWTGTRIVVFEVSGAITLSSHVRVTTPNVWVAGQTAPGPIVLTNKSIAVRASNVVLDHIAASLDRSRDEADRDDNDPFSIVSNRAVRRVENVWLRACSAMGGGDEAIVLNTTTAEGIVSNVVISDTLSGEMISGTDGAYAEDPQHHYGPSLTGGARAQLVDNVIAGTRARSPQAAPGSWLYLGGSYICDFANFGSLQFWQGASIAPVYHKADSTHIASFKDTVSAIVSNVAITGRNTLQASNRIGGNFSTPGWLSTGSLTLYEQDNYFPNVPPVHAISDGDVGPGRGDDPLPPSGKAKNLISRGGRTVTETPVLWGEELPTHHSEILNRLDRVGPRPNDRAPIVRRYIEQIA